MALQPHLQAGIVVKVVRGIPNRETDSSVRSKTLDDDSSSHFKSRPDNYSEERPEAQCETCGGNSPTNDEESSPSGARHKENKKPSGVGGWRKASEGGHTAVERKEGRGKEGQVEKEERGDDDGDEDEHGDHFQIDTSPTSLKIVSTKRPRQNSKSWRRSANTNSRGGSGGGKTSGTGSDSHVTKAISNAMLLEPARDTASAKGANQGHRIKPGGKRVRGSKELGEDMQRCLDEVSKAFQLSIRRAVLNYILLDARQQKRLGGSSGLLYHGRHGRHVAT